MKCIDEISAADLRGKRVLLRAGLDVPIGKDGEVADAFRLVRSCATLAYLKNSGARVIVIAKIGRDPSDSLAPVARALNKDIPTFFVQDILGPAAQTALSVMKEGEVVMLENLQQDPREIAGDDTFAKALAAYGEIYVNDCFASAHRTSASMTGIPKFIPSYAGFVMRDEVQHLNEALHPPHPSFVIIGGAKFETKDPIIRSFLNVYDHVCVVGAIANDVLKARGLPVGRSRISEHEPEKEIAVHPNLLVPVDVTAERSDKQASVKKVEDVGPDDKIVDIGPETIAAMAPYIEQAKFILWNGPTGLYEEGYVHYTQAIAEMISKSSAQKVIGGGDTIALLQESNVDEKNLGFFSTGGGAMLEYLLKGTLPAIDALG